MANRVLGVVAAALSPDPREAPLLARQLGFAGLLFDAYAPALQLPDLSATGRREFRHTISGQNQGLIGLRGSLGPKGLGHGADVDRVISQVDRAMECARSLTAPLLCIDLGPLPHVVDEVRAKPAVTAEMAGLLILPTTATGGPPKAIEKSPPPDPAFVAQVDSALTELGVRADRYGVTVALRSDLANVASLERAILAARCPWFGIDFDPVAVVTDDDWDIDEVFSRLGALIRHVRARDAVRGQGNRTSPAVIGKGAVNWEEVVARLEEAGYGGAITVDPTELSDRPAAARAGADHLRSLLR